MKLFSVKETIKCDGLYCKNLAEVRIDLEIYKGYIFLCKKCRLGLEKLLKKGADNEK